jgi:hypothetical protein
MFFIHQYILYSSRFTHDGIKELTLHHAEMMGSLIYAQYDADSFSNF